MTPLDPAATVIVVAYGLERLETDWARAPEAVTWQLVVVHNDDRLADIEIDALDVVNIRPGRNEGFARAVNRGLEHAVGRRIVLANPDASPTAGHIAALAAGDPEVVRSIPIVDVAGVPNSVVSRYPTPASLALTVARVGRLAPRGGKARRLLAPLLGRWGKAHAESLAGDRAVPGTKWPLAEYWCAGTLVSFDRERLQAVGGLDGRYFMYREDIDLCRRLETRFPGMYIEITGENPVVHAVGGTAVTEDDRRRVRWARWASAAIYCRANKGAAWRALGVVSGGVAGVMARRSAVRSLGR